MRKIIFMIILAFMLSGCTGKQPKPEYTSVPEPSVQPSEAKNEKTVIIYAGGMDETPATMRLIEEFNRKSENVYVKYQELPYSLNERYKETSSSLASGRSEYDVINIELIYNAEFASKGYIRELGAYIERDGIDISSYLPAAVTAVKYEDRIYSMPKSIAPGMLYYRSDLTENPPEDWDRLIQMAREAQENGYTKYGFVFSGVIDDSFVVEALEFIYSYGGKLMDPNGNLAVNVAETVKGLEKLKEIYCSDIVPEDISSISLNDACVSFLQGDSAFMRNLPYAWALSTNSSSPVTKNIAIAPLPKGDKKAVTLFGGFSSAITASSKHPDEAWEFVKFIISHEGQVISAVEGGRIPTLTSVMNDNSVLESNPHFGSRSFRAIIDNAHPRPVTPHYSSFMRIFQENLSQYLRDQLSAEEMLVQFANQMSGVVGG